MAEATFLYQEILSQFTCKVKKKYVHAFVVRTTTVSLLRLAVMLLSTRD